MLTTVWYRQGNNEHGGLELSRALYNHLSFNLTHISPLTFWVQISHLQRKVTCAHPSLALSHKSHDLFLMSFWPVSFFQRCTELSLSYRSWPSSFLSNRTETPTCIFNKSLTLLSFFQNRSWFNNLVCQSILIFWESVINISVMIEEFSKRKSILMFKSRQKDSVLASYYLVFSLSFLFHDVLENNLF